MTSGKKSELVSARIRGLIASAFVLASMVPLQARGLAPSETKFIQVAAQSKEERSAIVNHGMSIEAVRSDSVWGFANENALRALKASGFRVLGEFSRETGRGGHDGDLGTQDFPAADARYHNYAETVAALRDLNLKHADITRLVSIGKTYEKRDLWALHINTSPEALGSQQSGKPGVLFMGAHHAREHLSVEVPLMLAQHLLNNRNDAQIARLLDTRDIWILPMVNPDGAEYDVSGGKYHLWRKNRRDNRDGTFGVDLNRNYGFKWGTGGSSKDTSSDIYMGPEPFSEPETQAIRDFVRARVNARILLSFHTYSELILYPWGATYEPIGKARDLAVFKKMATTMAQWNHYVPQQSSELYIASGDTTDWAYGELGIFAFTFELSPSGYSAPASAGLSPLTFYPGPGMIDSAFAANLKPCLYLLEVADDPYKVVESAPSGGLKNYVQPKDYLGWN